MKTGPIITAIVAMLALAAVVAAFMSNASPYVTIAQAKTASGDRLHLAGDIIKPTVKTDLAHHALTFDIRDKNGDVVTIVHKGESPQSMSEATEVVAIGKMEGDQFVSEKLLVKCPSRYEAKKQSS
jgi:cytochrome c-type biogenesis protein CcmE